MSKQQNEIARYQIILDAGGARYRFYCERSQMAICTVGPIRSGPPEQALRRAWEEGRKYFNFCPKCGKWVCNAMFNVETSECVACSPWTEKLAFCPQCGAPVSPQNRFCRTCGTKFLKEGV